MIGTRGITIFNRFLVDKAVIWSPTSTEGASWRRSKHGIIQAKGIAISNFIISRIPEKAPSKPYLDEMKFKALTADWGNYWTIQIDDFICPDFLDLSIPLTDRELVALQKQHKLYPILEFIDNRVGERLDHWRINAN